MIFKSIVLNDVFDQIYNEFDDPRMFGRFRNYLISHGLKYSYYTREYVLSTIKNDFYTMFGEIIYKLIGNDIKKITSSIINNTYNFEEEINNSNSELTIEFINSINICKNMFIEKENDIINFKEGVGECINIILESLGATNYEKQCYWKHISDKDILTPDVYLGYLKYIDIKNIDRDELIHILSIDDINKLNKNQKSYLPNNISITHQLIKAFLDSRD